MIQIDEEHDTQLEEPAKLTAPEQQKEKIPITLFIKVNNGVQNGLVMNEFPSVRIDNVGKISNSEVKVLNGGVVVNKKATPLVEYVHVVVVVVCCC